MVFEIVNAVFLIVGVSGIVIGGAVVVRYGPEYFRLQR